MDSSNNQTEDVPGVQVAEVAGEESNGEGVKRSNPIWYNLLIGASLTGICLLFFDINTWRYWTLWIVLVLLNAFTEIRTDKLVKGQWNK